MVFVVAIGFPYGVEDGVLQADIGNGGEVHFVAVANQPSKQCCIPIKGIQVPSMAETSDQLHLGYKEVSFQEGSLVQEGIEFDLLELVISVILHKQVQPLRKYPQPKGCGMGIIVSDVPQIFLGALR